MEVEYRLRRLLTAAETEETLSIIAQLPLEIEESNEEWRHEAARIKATHRLSSADAWIAAQAILRDAKLVHKDPEFDEIRELIAARLPYKQRQRS